MIVHEAVCAGCGKREPARYSDQAGTPWEVMAHPDGWLLIIPSDRSNVGPLTPIEAYCSRDCVGRLVGSAHTSPALS